MSWLLPLDCPEHQVAVFRLNMGIKCHLEFSMLSSLAAESTYLRPLLFGLPTMWVPWRVRRWRSPSCLEDLVRRGVRTSEITPKEE